MNADLDMNSNDLLNVNELSTGSLTLNGALVVPTSLSIAVSFFPDNFTGNGSAVAFTLTYDPLSKNNTFVYIDGIYQNKNTYSLSGKILTFSEAPPVSSSIEVMTVRTTT
jgi:outer membrane protein assembly factor BamA